MKTKMMTPAERSAPNVIVNETHAGTPRRATVSNVIGLGQQLAEASGAARKLVDRTPNDLQILIGEVRRWYCSQPPDERDRLAAEAQQAQRVGRVGLLENVAEGDPDTLNMISSFRQRLHELRWSDGPKRARRGSLERR